MGVLEDALTDRMRKLEIIETDLEEGFARSSGPGVQNVNKVADLGLIVRRSVR
jgi:protein subunit release factor B